MQDFKSDFERNKKLTSAWLETLFHANEKAKDNTNKYTKKPKKGSDKHVANCLTKMRGKLLSSWGEGRLVLSLLKISFPTTAARPHKLLRTLEDSSEFFATYKGSMTQKKIWKRFPECEIFQGTGLYI